VLFDSACDTDHECAILLLLIIIYSSLKDIDDVQRQVESLYCAENKLRGTFNQCTPAVKNTLFCFYCTPVYACQLWNLWSRLPI